LAVAEAPRSDVTRLLGALARGETDASDELFPVVYGELRKIAASAMRAERAGHTLQPTALVHEAYMRLVNQRAVQWESRGHFFALAAQAMRRVLVDHARRRAAQKRPAAAIPLPTDDGVGPSVERPFDLIALDLAMNRLAAKDPRLVKVVELRFFAGLSVEETGAVMAVSPRTVKRDWHIARAWLKRELASDSGHV
jgi:RNA polymerase sigma-70 factor (ECF subfamily)